MVTEKNLRILILFLYGSALSHMLWTGQIYRFVGGWLIPWLWASCAVIWVLVIGMIFSAIGQRKVSAEPADSLLPVESGAAPMAAGWDVAQGVLYALFALAPVIYLVGALTYDLRWF